VIGGENRLNGARSPIALCGVGAATPGRTKQLAAEPVSTCARRRAHSCWLLHSLAKAIINAPHLLCHQKNHTINLDVAISMLSRQLDLCSEMCSNQLITYGAQNSNVEIDATFLDDHIRQNHLIRFFLRINIKLSQKPLISKRL
jgi:hypothetical protein